MQKKQTKKKTGTLKKYNRKYEKQFSYKYTDADIERIADEMYEWFIAIEKNEEGNMKPPKIWLKDFAIKKMIGRQRFADFCKGNDYFKYMYGICKDIQESVLVRYGMASKGKPTFPIFALKNVAGWRDRVEQTPRDDIEEVVFIQ